MIAVFLLVRATCECWRIMGRGLQLAVPVRGVVSSGGLRQDPGGARTEVAEKSGLCESGGEWDRWGLMWCDKWA